MNFRSDSNIAISVIAAVVLWSVATLLESQFAGRDGDAASAGQAAFPSGVREDTGVRSERPAQGCTEAEQSLMQLVDASQSCETDEDCTIFDYGYPIQCMTSINKDRIPAIRQSYASYEQSCEYRVYYDCPSEPFVRVPLCRANRCIVELHTLDGLKDETLDHIGNRGRRPRAAPES